MEGKYVSRGGDKLAGAAAKLGLEFKDKIVLDAGSSTGGFTDYALSRGAKKVYSVDSGTNQLHASLRGNAKIELHEKTDIRAFEPELSPDIILIDLSFISLRKVLPGLAKIAGKETEIVALVKPQFEALPAQLNRGVVKNDTIRRKILKDFEVWSQKHFLTIKKADSELTGASGNLERFYLLKSLS